MKQEDLRHIQSKAIRERLMFKQLRKIEDIIFNVKYTPYNGKDEYDVTYSQLKDNKIESCIAEIKVRETGYTQVVGGYFIEQPKYNYLMSRANEFDKVLYINFFEDGILIWDLKKCPTPNFQLTEARINNHSQSTKIKDVGCLWFWDAIYVKKIELNIYQTLLKSYNIWDRINRK
jgi:hypothetical protein